MCAGVQVECVSDKSSITLNSFKQAHTHHHAESPFSHGWKDETNDLVILRPTLFRIPHGLSLWQDLWFSDFSAAFQKLLELGLS